MATEYTFSNDYFYPFHYFPPQMHLCEILRLHVQVRAVWSGYSQVFSEIFFSKCEHFRGIRCH